MNEVITIDGQLFLLTDEHASSSYGQVVLLTDENIPLGPGDICNLRLETATEEAVRALGRAGFTFDDCRR